MVERINIKKRAPMNISIASRLLGVAITIFILILTIKSELLKDEIIIIQLALSIPFLLVSMITNAKIVDSKSLKHYYLANRIANSIGISLIINTIGLLIATYSTRSIGIIFFITLLAMLSILLYLDFNKRKIYNEFLIIILILTFGLIPSIIGI